MAAKLRRAYLVELVGAELQPEDQVEEGDSRHVVLVFKEKGVYSWEQRMAIAHDAYFEDIDGLTSRGYILGMEYGLPLFGNPESRDGSVYKIGADYWITHYNNQVTALARTHEEVSRLGEMRMWSRNKLQMKERNKRHYQEFRKHAEAAKIQGLPPPNWSNYDERLALVGEERQRAPRTSSAAGAALLEGQLGLEQGRLKNQECIWLFMMHEKIQEGYRPNLIESAKYKNFRERFFFWDIHDSDKQGPDNPDGVRTFEEAYSKMFEPLRRAGKADWSVAYFDQCRMVSID